MQEHVPGSVHVPPFIHSGVQIAKIMLHCVRVCYYFFLLPSWQRTPLHPATHVQIPGDVHVPPFSHSGVQVDPMIGGVVVVGASDAFMVL